jgi:hypothetical protein
MRRDMSLIVSGWKQINLNFVKTYLLSSCKDLLSKLNQKI